MKIAKLSLAALLLITFLTPASAAPQQENGTQPEDAAIIVPEISAVSAVLIDCGSGRILYEQNPDEERMIASITKLMTALVAAEACPDFSESVTIRPEWTGAEGSSLYLKAGETWRLETLLYGLLLHSGNDAAIAIAGYCAGDVDTFVGWMNERAKDLGMENTHFQNPNGLNHEEHYSTAADMAKLAVYCMQNETIAKIVATKSVSMEGRAFKNHNKLLWQYEGCVGMKTGYTELAGRTLISSAKRNGQTLAAVTLSDPDDWKDHANLLDYGFEAYPAEVFFARDEIFDFLPVEGSFTRSVSLVVADDISYPLRVEERDAVEIEVLAPEFVAAPVQSGSIAGCVRLMLGEEELCSSYLLYGTSIARDSVVANEQIQNFLGLGREEKRSIYDVFFSEQ